MGRTFPDALQNLREYIAIPSINPMSGNSVPAELVGERRYAEHLEAQCKRIGLDAVLVGEGDRVSVVAEARVRQATDTVLIASHLDTVPVDAMEIDPFDPRIEGDRIYGRGSCDTKSGMATALAALGQLLTSGALKRNVILVGEADEECGSVGVRNVLDHLGTRRPDWALVTEPTGMELVTHHKGVGRVELRAKGIACHSSNPDLGRSAILDIAKAIIALDDLARRLREHQHPRLGPATLSIGLVEGGQAVNIVAPDARIQLDRRLLPGEDAESFHAEIAGAMRDANLPHVEIAVANVSKPALATGADTMPVRQCRAALRAVGLSPTPAVASFGTDASLFAQSNLPSVVLGPGHIEQAHTAREYVEISQVEKANAFFLALLGS